MNPSHIWSYYCLWSHICEWWSKDTRFCTFLCSRADGAPCWLALGNNGDLDLGSLGGFAWRGTRRLPPLSMGPQFISVQALHLITGHWHCTTQTNTNTDIDQTVERTWIWAILSFCDPPIDIELSTRFKKICNITFIIQELNCYFKKCKIQIMKLSLVMSQTVQYFSVWHSCEIRVMETRKEVKRHRGKRKGKRDRHLPKIQGGVPGGRFFLTSMFCFIKAANWAGMNWKKSRKRKL